jgi:hypothetical protein
MAIWTERQRQLIADAEDACEREDAADNVPDDIRDRVLARLQAVTDEQIDQLIARALEGPPSYLRLVLQLAGVSLKERDVRKPVKGANLIIIEPTQEELDEYAATHQPTPAPAEHPTPTTQDRARPASDVTPQWRVAAGSMPHHDVPGSVPPTRSSEGQVPAKPPATAHARRRPDGPAHTDGTAHANPGELTAAQRMQPRAGRSWPYDTPG